MRIMLAVAFLATVGARTWAASFLISPTPDSCLTIPANPNIGTIGVGVTGLTDLPCAMIGAQLRIEGLPPGWVAWVAAPQTAYSVVGNLFGDGATITFSDYQYLDPLALFQITLWPGEPGAAAVLRIKAAILPMDPQHACPGIFGDYCPGSSAFACATGGTLYINAPRCLLPVNAQTWSQVRLLYR